MTTSYMSRSFLARLGSASLLSVLLVSSLAGCGNQKQANTTATGNSQTASATTAGGSLDVS